MESIDFWFAELKADYQESAKAEPDCQKASVLSSPTIQTSGKNLYAAVLDSDLAQIKAEYEQRDKAAEVAQQELQQAQLVGQQQSQVLTRREKVRQAQVWLKKLDKNSDEGFWFDRFAFKYDSRIEAAIDYLQAVKEFE